jgi:hypothetical protein
MSKSTSPLTSFVKLSISTISLLKSNELLLITLKILLPNVETFIQNFDNVDVVTAEKSLVLLFVRHVTVKFLFITNKYSNF